MKKAFSFLLLFSFLTLFSCRVAPAPRLSYRGTELSLTVSYRQNGRDYLAQLRLFEDGRCALAFQSPESLAGLTLTRDDSHTEATLDGTTIALPENASLLLFPCDLFCLRNPEIRSTARTGSLCVYTVSSENETYYFTFLQGEAFPASVSYDGALGTIELEVQRATG